MFDIVITATGILHQPAYPDIEGLDRFAGACFHTARWDDEMALEGTRVGIIGTGSTAAQIVGAITDQVGEMVVFQRTPQWMAPLPQKHYSRAWRRALQLFPFLRRVAYNFHFRLMVNQFSAATVGDKKKQAGFSRRA